MNPLSASSKALYDSEPCETVLHMQFMQCLRSRSKRNVCQRVRNAPWCFDPSDVDETPSEPKSVMAVFEVMD